ncbi:hypothetical protein ACH5RR_007267 [Cinchona calisaya]|uniref:Glycosyltransferase N-terminal domain-containing protein n=1 Tax=Cinchona calisaya TaxID=153742 RepID=A0ABD3ARC4_9GENT
MTEFIRIQVESRVIKSGNLYITCRAMEGPFLDLIAKAKMSETDRQWAIDQKVEEIAIELEKSEQKFIWVLRDANKGHAFDGEVRRAQLPEGFEERMEKRGMILRDWAPQLGILGHLSTVGFISHCGWNSCIESITMGVPVAAWPMHSDQPRNALLLEKVLKIGQIVSDWSRRDEPVTSVVVENVVRRLMDSAEGEEMRQRIGELSKVVKESVMDGGVSRLELDSFIAHIRR